MFEKFPDTNLHELNLDWFLWLGLRRYGYAAEGELEKAGGTGETEGAPDAENSGSDSLL